MEKFSTAAVCLCLALAASAAPATARENCEFLASAPDEHRVARGDTLWGLAATFLKDPWCWPQVWELNRTRIRDPHWIYPGQVILFDRSRQRLRLAATGSAASERLSPSARSTPVNDVPVPAIDPEWERFGRQLRMLPAREADRLPRILGFSERRRIAGPGDIALVEGELATAAATTRRHEVLRMLPPVVDPDDGSLLAVPLQRIGLAEYLWTDGTLLHRFRMTSAERELAAGDRLVLAEDAAPASADNRPPVQLHPAPPFEGRVASLLHGGRWAAQHDVVALNRGRQAGLDGGSLVAVVRQVRIAGHDSLHHPASPQAIATLLVLEAHEQVSLALVLRSADAIAVGDRVRSVEQAPR